MEGQLTAQPAASGSRGPVGKGGGADSATPSGALTGEPPPRSPATAVLARETETASPVPAAPGHPAHGTPPTGAPPAAPAQPGRLLAFGERAGVLARRVGARPRFDLALVVVLMAVAIGLRWRTIGTNYWGDEAIAIGIATHSIGSLPHYLVNDGSPPLYYVALHYWMDVFGRSEVATHALSLIPAVMAVPVSWWAGNRLFGHWAARAAAAMVATCAYLDYYATETRMYSWLVMTAIVALTFFVLAVRGEGRRYWLGATGLMATILYLQYWGLYVLAATSLVGSLTGVRSRDWRLVRSTVLYFAACAAAFAPWAPQFVRQLTSTGAPWAPKPNLLDLIGDVFNAVASAGWAGPLVALVVAAQAAYLRGRVRRTAAGMSGRPPRWWRPGPVPSTLTLASAVPLTTIAVAWLAGQIVNSWNPRYLGIAVVPALVALAGGLAAARRGFAALVLSVCTVTATAVPLLVDRQLTVTTAKSNVAEMLQRLHPLLHPGALVISTEVTNMPVIALDLGPGYRYASPLGLLRDPLVVNWTDLPTRLQAVSAQSNLEPLLNSLPAGGQVLMVNPTAWGGQETPARYLGPVKAEGVAANQVVVDDPRLAKVAYQGVSRYSNPLYPMTATLFVKVAGHRAR